MKSTTRFAGALVASVFLLALPAHAGKVGPASETMATTRAATPLADAPTSDEYLRLDGLSGFRVCLSAASGQTLSGGGTLQAWVYSDDLGRWVRNPGSDLTVSASSSGLRDACFNDQTVTTKTGSVFYAASSVTVSSGSVTVTLVGWK